MQKGGPRDSRANRPQKTAYPAGGAITIRTAAARATNASLQPPERTSRAHALFDQLTADRLLGLDKRVNRGFLGPLGRLDLEIQRLGRELLGSVDIPRRRFLGARGIEAPFGHA